MYRTCICHHICQSIVHSLLLFHSCRCVARQLNATDQWLVSARVECRKPTTTTATTRQLKLVALSFPLHTHSHPQRTKGLQGENRTLTLAEAVRHNKSRQIRAHRHSLPEPSRTPSWLPLLHWHAIPYTILCTTMDQLPSFPLPAHRLPSSRMW